MSTAKLLFKKGSDLHSQYYEHSPFPSLLPILGNTFSGMWKGPCSDFHLLNKVEHFFKHVLAIYILWIALFYLIFEVQDLQTKHLFFALVKN